MNSSSLQSETTPAADPAREYLRSPFTPAIALRDGLGRAGLDRAVRSGSVVRLLRGVYLDVEAPLEAVTRAQAVALVVSSRHVVVGRTAAWIHGGPPSASEANDAEPVPIEIHGRRRYPSGSVPLNRDEIEVLGGVRCTSALRTAVDLARYLPAERSLPLVDAMIRAGALVHGDLHAAVAAASRLPGGASVAEVAALADGRAADVAESLLRLHWFAARLPTPAPAWQVGGVRVALALPLHRFGVALSGRLARRDLALAQSCGWTLVVLDEIRVRRSDPQSLCRHLEREFHRHLLTQAGSGGGVADRGDP